MSVEQSEAESKLERAGGRRGSLIRGGQRFMREKFQGGRYLIPSLFTMIGIFCGFLGVVSVIKGRFEYAAMCIGLAIILDGVDGRVARSLNATSAFGREFDSLSDLIAFGVAPAALIYSWAFVPAADEFGVLVAFVFVVSSATRLARFNIKTAEEDGPSTTFQGLPTPGAAAALASFVYCSPAKLESELFVGGMCAYMILLSLLMVSTYPFLSVKMLKLTDGNPRRNAVILSALVALVWKYNRIMLLVFATTYVISGVAGAVWKRFFPQSWAKQLKHFELGA